MGSDLKQRALRLIERINNLANTAGIEERKVQLRELQARASLPDFWEQEENPAAYQQKIKETLALLAGFDSLLKEAIYLNEVLEFIDDNSIEAEQIGSKISKIATEIDNKEVEIFLNKHYDSYPAIITVKSGAGGRDAEDWTALIARMYQRYCEQKGWNIKVVYQQFAEGGGPEGRIGLKEIVMQIKAAYAYGLMARETGVHRLVRVSPFSAKQLRHTSFASVEVLPLLNEVDLSAIAINPDDLSVETFHASGPGGQNVNKRESAVRITHLPTGLQTSSQVERTQQANRKIALEMLMTKLINLAEQKREQELRSLKNKPISVSFGSQNRSYVLYPYKLVKDHRTGLEKTDPDAVLDGDIEDFIRSGIKLN